MRFDIRFLDHKHHTLATATVEDKAGTYSGTVNLQEMPQSIRRLFEEYEQLVNDQVFSLLDEIERRVTEMAITVSFSDGRIVFPSDLQIFPAAGKVSFKAVEQRALQDEHILRV